jgi:hypothetical protein
MKRWNWKRARGLYVYAWSSLTLHIYIRTVVRVFIFSFNVCIFFPMQAIARICIGFCAVTTSSCCTIIMYLGTVLFGTLLVELIYFIDSF